jgi:hypothetical protein
MMLARIADSYSQSTAAESQFRTYSSLFAEAFFYNRVTVAPI